VDWVGCPDDRHSIGGFAIYLGSDTRGVIAHPLPPKRNLDPRLRRETGLKETANGCSYLTVEERSPDGENELGTRFPTWLLLHNGCSIAP
jgi:hypothetical protein